MKNRRLEKLFRAARSEPAPVAADGFASRVLRRARQDQPPETASISDQLGELFPRLAPVAAGLIGLCVAADFCLATFVQPDLFAGVAEASEQWLFAVR